MEEYYKIRILFNLRKKNSKRKTRKFSKFFKLKKWTQTSQNKPIRGGIPKNPRLQQFLMPKTAKS